MSEKEYSEIVKKLTVSIISGVAVLVIVGIFTNLYVARATTDRSIRNEREVGVIKDELKTFVKKGDDNGIHLIFKEQIDENRDDIKKFNDKVDEIKTLVITLHNK